MARRRLSHCRPAGRSRKGGQRRERRLGSALARRARLPDASAQVAQLVEHVTENHGVGGSIPPLGTILPPFHISPEIVQKNLAFQRFSTSAFLAVPDQSGPIPPGNRDVLGVRPRPYGSLRAYGCPVSQCPGGGSSAEACRRSWPVPAGQAERAEVLAMEVSDRQAGEAADVRYLCQIWGWRRRAKLMRMAQAPEGRPDPSLERRLARQGRKAAERNVEQMAKGWHRVWAKDKSPIMPPRSCRRWNATRFHKSEPIRSGKSTDACCCRYSDRSRFAVRGSGTSDGDGT